MALAGDIEALDYNTIRANIVEVMGTGLATYGYGQNTVSTTVSAGNTISASQWTGLRFDVINALIHQTGTTPAIVLIESGDVIDDRSADPVVNYSTLTTQARSNRFNLAPSQSISAAIGSPKTYTSDWTSLASLTCTMTFNNANEARYFFNSGGNVKITTTRVGGTASLQNESWTALLTEAGTQLFKASTGEETNFYTLTDEYQTIYELSSSAAYADNTYKISAKCDVENNNTGTATEIDIKVELIDAYVDSGPEVLPNDVVNGTLTISLEEQKASGVLQPVDVADGGPTGAFAITSPSYTVSNITAT